jgi:hypothetical protein
MRQIQVKRADSPNFMDRLALRLSTARYVDGLWVGTWEDNPEPILRRIEDALALINRYDRIRYNRLVRDLHRVWVIILPAALGSFDSKLYACKIDTRFVLADTTTPELIASTIVHEATHARLWRRGIGYEQAQRPRIEAICFRREIAFAAKLPDGGQVRDMAERTLTLCADQSFWTNAAFYERHVEGSFEGMRYYGTPEWLIRILRVLLPGIRRLVQGLARLRRMAAARRR